jgi:PAS domain S-box-containing protein
MSRETVDLSIAPNPVPAVNHVSNPMKSGMIADLGPEWGLVAALLEALPVALYATDAAGRIVFYNTEAAALWGREPDIDAGERCGSGRLFWPDGNPIPQGQCPMAVALKERRAIKGAEAIAERPDGSRVRFLAYPTPLFDAADKLIGAVNMLVDITDRDHSIFSEQRLASIVESSHDAIISKDLDGIILTWNDAAERLYGYKAAEIIGRPVTVLIPEERHDEESVIQEKILRGEPVTHYETVRQRKDGTLVDISLTVSPVRNAAGRIVGASKIARDITERKRAQEQQKLLLGEMSHRVKNVLAVAGGLVSLSARTAQTPEEMAKAVQNRLGAYSRAHDLTRPGLIAGEFSAGLQTMLHTLIWTIVAPYIDPVAEDGRTNITVDGADLLVDGSTATSLALVLHEFTTNAAKYGALSAPRGRVHIDCRIKDDTFEIKWQEIDGPVVNGRPNKQGFGSLLAQKSVEGQLGGTITHDWKREGVSITLRMPLDRLTRPAG